MTDPRTNENPASPTAASPGRDRQGAGPSTARLTANTAIDADTRNSPGRPDGSASDASRTCGLVVYLTHDAGLARQAQAAIAANDHITLGAPAPHALPVVLESPDATTERQQIRWLESLPGVRLVTVAYAHFGDQPQPHPQPATESQS